MVIYKIYTDGASRGNPGKSGFGLVIYKDDEIFYEDYRYLGIMTNNQAEYLALIRALELLSELNINEACIYADSQLMIKQMRGEYKVKAKNMIPLYNEAINKISNKKIIFNWIRREENKFADELANRAIDLAFKNNFN